LQFGLFRGSDALELRCTEFKRETPWVVRSLILLRNDLSRDLSPGSHPLFRSIGVMMNEMRSTVSR